ncbi:MAG: outer membrane protein/peptidoglycan-associated protein [Verrucomicrobiaceae bacterium]|nr:outer membrane protein/peptidoglycan-associated protein [Verrucomicrobiaceae bacterium]
MHSRNEKLKPVAQNFLDFSKCAIPLLAVLLFFGVAAAENSSYQLLQTNQSAGLIFSAHKDYAKYELVVGKMEYIEDARSEGFKPAEKRELIGSIDRRLYDYPKQKSAIQIYENTMAALKYQHYRIVYQCSGDVCGGAAGWRLFLNNKLGGDSRFQHYVVATKDDLADTSYYFVLYVNDLAGQPRALVDVITVPKSPLISDANSRGITPDTPPIRNGDTTKTSIYFDFGQSALADRTDQLIRAKQFVESHRDQCPIHVVGYTDAIGGETSNQQLAKARVEAVIDYLHDIKEISPNCLVPEPRGIEAAAAGGGRIQSRRVDLELAANQ